MSESGVPLTRSVVANLESGRRPTVSLAEIIAAAAILEVSPVGLIFGGSSEVDILQEFTAPADATLGWFCGVGPLAGGDFRDGDDPTPVTLLHRHRRQLMDVRTFDATAVNVRARRRWAETAPADEVGDRVALTADLDREIGRTSDLAQEAWTRLLDTRQAFRTRGWEPPALPSYWARCEEAGGPAMWGQFVVDGARR